MKIRWLGSVGSFAIVALLCATSTRIAAASDWTANIKLQYGKRSTDSREWEPVNHDDSAGIEATWGKQDQQLLFATDLYYSTDDKTKTGVKTRLEAYELALGFRKIWEVKFLRPYAGAGLSLIQDELTVSVPAQSVSVPAQKTTGKDRGAGFWLGGGLDFQLGPPSLGARIGIFARYTPTNHVRPLRDSIDGSSSMVGISAGLAWGAKKKS